MAKSKIKDRRRVGDFYTQKAKAEKYPARSVYKLEEIDKKHGLFKPGYRVLDLGCAPGSWAMYAAKKVGPNGLVIGVDLNEPNGNFEDNTRIIVNDIHELDADEIAADGRFDVVMSDMAPKTTGHKSTDQIRSVALVETAFDWAKRILKPGGSFLFKIFMGPDVETLHKTIALDFKSIHRIKPKSSRSFSPEIFGLGLGFKG